MCVLVGQRRRSQGVGICCAAIAGAAHFMRGLQQHKQAAGVCLFRALPLPPLQDAIGRARICTSCAVMRLVQELRLFGIWFIWLFRISRSKGIAGSCSDLGRCARPAALTWPPSGPVPVQVVCQRDAPARRAPFLQQCYGCTATHHALLRAHAHTCPVYVSVCRAWRHAAC